MRSTQLRSIVIDKAALTDVLTALELLRNGQGLTAGESGTVAYDPISDVELIGAPQVVWNGISYAVFLFVSAG